MATRSKKVLKTLADKAFEPEKKTKKATPKKKAEPKKIKTKKVYYYMIFKHDCEYVGRAAIEKDTDLDKLIRRRRKDIKEWEHRCVVITPITEGLIEPKEEKDEEDYY